MLLEGDASRGSDALQSARRVGMLMRSLSRSGTESSGWARVCSRRQMMALRQSGKTSRMLERSACIANGWMRRVACRVRTGCTARVSSALVQGGPAPSSGQQCAVLLRRSACLPNAMAEVRSILSGWRCFSDASGPHIVQAVWQLHVVEACPACPRSCDGTLLW